jgi:SAM-dependent methyltransferase
MEEETVLAFGSVGGGSSEPPFLFVVPDHSVMTAYYGWYSAAMGDTYTHGHHQSVLRSHAWRSAGNSAAYLLGELRPGQRLLDVGCGPGTITLDLARRVSPGRVIGIDTEPGVLRGAEALRRRQGIDNVTFEPGDAYALDYDDDNFDVIHLHQVLQHLTDPVRALIELRRVLATDGVLGARDSDYAGFFWSPADPLLDRWLALYHELTAQNGAMADAGRELPGWVRAAGFADIAVTSSTWIFADPASRVWWGGLWAERVTQSSFAKQACDYGLSDDEELAAIAAAWRRWAEAPDAVFVVPHVEILARPGAVGDDAMAP